jgi:hypothetical protein
MFAFESIETSLSNVRWERTLCRLCHREFALPRVVCDRHVRGNLASASHAQSTHTHTHKREAMQKRKHIRKRILSSVHFIIMFLTSTCRRWRDWSRAFCRAFKTFGIGVALAGQIGSGCAGSGVRQRRMGIEFLRS